MPTTMDAPVYVIDDPHIVTAIICLVAAWIVLLVLWGLINADKHKPKN